MISAIVYHIWKARNEVLWEGKTETTKHTVQKVKQALKLRFNVVKPRHMSEKELEWLDYICAE